MYNCLNEIFSSGQWKSRWKHTRKKSYSLKARIGRHGEEIYNVLEGTKYSVNMNTEYIVVMSGTVGEEWVISTRVLKAKYCLPDGSPITDEYIKYMSKVGKFVNIKSVANVSGYTNYALQISDNIFKDIPILTSYGDVLYANRRGVNHGKGDFLVCSTKEDVSPDFSDMWVVNGLVFPNTYDLRAFNGKISR